MTKKNSNNGNISWKIRNQINTKKFYIIRPRKGPNKKNSQIDNLIAQFVKLMDPHVNLYNFCKNNFLTFLNE